MTAPRPDDELLRRYHEASAQDTRGPGAQVRGAVRAHAQAVLAGQTASAESSMATPAPAANQSRWKLSLLASVAVVGLAGLLVLQFERGTPEEKELVAGQSAAGRSPAEPAPAPAPAPPSSSRETSPTAPTATQAPTTAATAKDPPVRSQPQPTRAAPPATVTVAPSPAAKAAPTLVAPIVPAVPVVPAELATARNRLADANATSTTSGADESAVSARSAAAPALRAAPAAPPPALASPPAFAPAPMAAPRAQAQLQKQEERSSEQPGARELSRAPAPSLHAAAGAGRLAQVELLITQGAAINAPDAAGRTPLMLASIHGHGAVVQRLLSAGANPALVDRDGLNALQHARRLGREAIAQMIEAGS